MCLPLEYYNCNTRQSCLVTLQAAPQDQPSNSESRLHPESKLTSHAEAKQSKNHLNQQNQKQDRIKNIQCMQLYESDIPRDDKILDLKCGNDPSAGSPTETLLRLHLPLNDKV
jgi:hypothetical protein